MQGLHATSGSMHIAQLAASTYARLKSSAPKQTKYVTIYRALHETIVNVGPGHSLPTAGQLAALIGVSYWTVSLAYGRLSSEGYLKPVKRWGAFINERYLWPRPAGRPGVAGDHADSYVS